MLQTLLPRHPEVVVLFLNDDHGMLVSAKFAHEEKITTSTSWSSTPSRTLLKEIFYTLLEPGKDQFDLLFEFVFTLIIFNLVTVHMP